MGIEDEVNVFVDFVSRPSNEKSTRFSNYKDVTSKKMCRRWNRLRYIMKWTSWLKKHNKIWSFLCIVSHWMHKWMNNLECGQSENFKNKPIGNLANQNQIKYNEQQRCGEYKFANKPERKRYWWHKWSH